MSFQKELRRTNWIGAVGISLSALLVAGVITEAKIRDDADMLRKSLTPKITNAFKSGRLSVGEEFSACNRFSCTRIHVDSIQDGCANMSVSEKILGGRIRPGVDDNRLAICKYDM